MKKSYFLILILLIGWGCGHTIKPEKGIDEKEKARKQEKLENFLRYYESVLQTNLYASGCPGAAVAIVKDSSIIYLKGFGVKDINTSDPIDENTVFRIGSLSKGFTAVMVSLLVKKGLLNWEDKVVDYVPYFELKDTAQTKRIQIKHLLSHSTGLPRHSLIELIEEGETMQEMIPKLKRVKLEGKEGEFFGYQNITFSIIQEIIETKTNKSLQTWIQEEIFNKAGMKHASMSYADLMAESNKSMPHERNSKKEWQVRAIHDKYYNTGAAGGVNASIADMAQWLLVLLGNRPDIVPAGSLDFIFTPFIQHEGIEYFDGWSGVSQSAYGMGWRVLQYQGSKVVCHGGFVNDYRAEIAVDMENKIGVCFLFNAQNYYARVAVPNFLDTYYMYESLAEE